jgi:23S rRNA pseudouridine1911/1915/1917 synthase
VENPEILFEDAFIIAVNKPSGIPSHNLPSTAGSDAESPPKTTIESLMAETRGQGSTFLLHRLDTGTSGVLLFSKDSQTYDAMREKFKLKQIKKYYRAWSDHEPDVAIRIPNEITLPLAHHPKSKKRMIVVPNDRKISFRGNPIPAHSRILSTEKKKWMGLPVTELKVEIITGVMHQIRVHLKHAGYTLAGDQIYNSNPNAFPRLGLHAERIEFELNGFQYLIEAPIP